MNLDHLDARMLLRVLRDPRVEAVAVEYYAYAQLCKLIRAIEQVVTPENSEQDGDAIRAE
jgi:hypothetical protein